MLLLWRVMLTALLCPIRGTSFLPQHVWQDVCLCAHVYTVHSDHSVSGSDGKRSSVKSTGSEGSCSLTTVDFKGFKVTWNKEIHHNRETWKNQATKGAHTYHLVSSVTLYRAPSSPGGHIIKHTSEKQLSVLAVRRHCSTAYFIMSLFNTRMSMD